jgi:aldehyde:ferredoxin oxidoreductase
MMNSIIRINTRTGKVFQDPCAEEYRYTGGRAFIARYLLNSVDPLCDPLGRFNALIFANGLLGDSQVTTSGRLSVGGKSPLTGGVKECNTGGDTGKKLGRLGIKAVVLDEAPEEPRTAVVYLSRDRREYLPMPGLRHLSVNDTAAALRNTFGPKVGILCIGPAGEMGLAGAGVAAVGGPGIQVRYAARGGLGAVMGAKGIKALVVDDTGTSVAPVFDKAALALANRELAAILREDPKTENRHNFGTPAVLDICNSLGILPTRNFRTGSFEFSGSIDGEAVADLILTRKGEGARGLPCITGCVIQCSNIFPDPSGKAAVASLQYETIALMGSNCGIGDLDDIAELNFLANEAGVDTIETGAAIGVAMEAGILPFGDAQGAKDLVRQISQGTPLGRIIGSGAAMTGRILNVRRVPVVHGQAMPAYDPRSLKGIGVTYVTSPMGADHTAGNALETVKTIDPLGRDKQVVSSYRLQIRGAVLDSLGVCLFIRPAFVKDPDLAARLLNARYGWSWKYRDVQNMSMTCLKEERSFNNLSGIDETRCDVPEFMRYEPLPPRNSIFDIPKEDMNRIWEIAPAADIF